MKNLLRRNVFRILLKACYVFCLLYLSNCGNLADRSKTSNPNLESDLVSGFGNSRLDILYLKKAQFDRIKRDTGNRKIVFQFCITDTSKSFSLCAWPSRKQQFNFGSEYLSFLIKDNKVLIKDTTFFGDQKIGPNKTRKIDSVFQTNANFKYLIFIPNKDRNNHIYYTIRVVRDTSDIRLQAFIDEASPFNFFINTNPSPPAHASEDLPDEPDIK